MTLTLNENIENLSKFIDEYYGLKTFDENIINDENMIILKKIKEYHNWNNDVKLRLFMMNKNNSPENIFNVVKCIPNGYFYREVYDTINLISLESLRDSDALDLKKQAIFLFQFITIIQNKRKEEIEEILNSSQSKFFIKNYQIWLNKSNQLNYINYII